MSARKEMLGTLLIQQGLLAPDQLEKALADQAQHGGRLGTILVAQGLVQIDDLSHCLAQQHDVSDAPIEKFQSITPAVLGALDPVVCAKYVMLPLTKEGQTVHVAMRDPHAADTPPELRNATFSLVPYAAPELRLFLFLERLLHVPRPDYLAHIPDDLILKTSPKPPPIPGSVRAAPSTSRPPIAVTLPSASKRDLSAEEPLLVEEPSDLSQLSIAEGVAHADGGDTDKDFEPLSREALEAEAGWEIRDHVVDFSGGGEDTAPLELELDDAGNFHDEAQETNATLIDGGSALDLDLDLSEDAGSTKAASGTASGNETLDIEIDLGELELGGATDESPPSGALTTLDVDLEFAAPESAGRLTGDRDGGNALDLELEGESGRVDDPIPLDLEER